MSQRQTQWAATAAALVILFVLGWAYHGDIGRLVTGPVSAAEQAYIGPYPAQFLPAVLLVLEPTPEPPPPTPMPTPPTLRVGLSVRWDGSGYILFDGYAWRPGTHWTQVVDQQIDGDTVRVLGEQWYSPNPLGFDDESWYCDYNTTTNRVESCSGEDDPAWKWGYYWLLPTDRVPVSGERLTIDGQVFNVTGPHTMDTGIGAVSYWQLRNRDRFLMVSTGNEWKQYVEAGDARLYYEVGSGFLVYSNVKRTFYEHDESTSNYVQYEQLISRREGANAADEPTVEEISAADLLARLSAAGIDPATLAAR